MFHVFLYLGINLSKLPGTGNSNKQVAGYTGIL